MVKHTQTIRLQFAETNCLSAFDHFVKLALKGLKDNFSLKNFHINSTSVIRPVKWTIIETNKPLPAPAHSFL